MIRQWKMPLALAALCATLMACNEQAKEEASPKAEAPAAQVQATRLQRIPIPRDPALAESAER